jgi:hypothetical protein
MVITVNSKRKYAMDVSVVSSLTGRGLYHITVFEFESFEQEPCDIEDDGKQQFLTGFKQRLAADPSIDRRINGTRYKLRTARLRTA